MEYLSAIEGLLNNVWYGGAKLHLHTNKMELDQESAWRIRTPNEQRTRTGY